MADTFQIMCINKPDRRNRRERIQNVGGVHNGQRWKITEDEAIQGIEDGRWQFFVSVNGNSTWVIVATHNGRKYLKTEADNTIVDNLLSLPECP